MVVRRREQRVSDEPRQGPCQRHLGDICDGSPLFSRFRHHHCRYLFMFQFALNKTYMQRTISEHLLPAGAAACFPHYFDEKVRKETWISLSERVE